MNYFSYTTTTEISIYRPTLLPPPAVSLCAHFQELIHDALPTIHDYNVTNMDRVRLNISLNEVFRLAPKHDKFLSSCSVYMTNGTPSDPLEHDCGKFFTFSRYLMQNQLCYVFEYKLEGLYDFEHLAREAERVAYILRLNTSALADLTFFRPIMHTRGLPFLSRYHATSVHGPGSIRGSGSTYQFSYAILEKKNLPAPYDTNCLPGTAHKNTCLVPCFIENVASQFNRLTTAWPLTESNDENYNYDLPLLYNTPNESIGD